jgi:S-adenosyl-L-methionine hydrolase (adenosine-forming)
MLVTLTTDFGDGSCYVAALKGALLSVNPAARLIGLSHRLPPQDLVSAAYFLADALPWFPSGTVHVVVVDPGVGTGRAILCVEWRGQTILVPDNGCWTSLLRPDDPPPRVFRVADRRYWRPEVSATFHGRDIFAPVAGHLTLGVKPADLGPPATHWVRLELPQPVVSAEGVRGEVVVVDPFGNLVSNIPAAAVPADAVVTIAGQTVPRRVRTYGEAEPGAVVALIGSNGRLEVAVVQGSAAARLGVGVGAPVEVISAGRP